jgi:predicted metal-dependent hydrolase
MNRIGLSSLAVQGSVASQDNRNTMRIDWSDEALAEGLRCYRNEEFFLAHEHWEGIWMQCEAEEKTFLQALIQITVAFHHRQRGNLAGTVSLLGRALRKLEGYPQSYCGVEVAALRGSLRAWLKALEAESDPVGVPFPVIR